MMARVEYALNASRSAGIGRALLQLVERLAELGRQGWHVASVI